MTGAETRKELVAIHKALDSDFVNRGRTIFVFQRHYDEAKALADALRALGHAAFCFTSVAEIVPSLELQKPDLMLLELPHGEKLLKHLRRSVQFESLPVIALWAEDSADQAVLGAYDHGADMVLVKPVPPDDLNKLIGMLCSRS